MTESYAVQDELRSQDEVIRKRPCLSPGSHGAYGMRLKYAFAAYIAAPLVALSLLSCTEPKSSLAFQGTISSITIVKDVFQGTENMSLRVVRYDAGDEECRQA